jgi:hypothetical protein
MLIAKLQVQKSNRGRICTYRALSPHNYGRTTCSPSTYLLHLHRAGVEVIGEDAVADAARHDVLERRGHGRDVQRPPVKTRASLKR